MVEVAQREQQHLLAVESDQIHVCVMQRKTLFERLDSANGATEEAVSALRETLGLDKEQAPTLSRLFKRLEPAYREHLRERCACLESLAQALGELNAINMVHAQRGLRVVRGFTALLADNGHVEASDAYTKNGRATQSRHTPGWLARSV
jgi:hypothetical protein